LASAVIADAPARTRLFVLTQDDQNTQNDLYQRDHPKNENKTGGGFAWGDALQFENCWEKLPPP
jgi:hypothetical protein